MLIHDNKGHTCILNADLEAQKKYGKAYDATVKMFAERHTSWTPSKKSNLFSESLETASMFRKLEIQGVPPFNPEVEILERF